MLTKEDLVRFAEHSARCNLICNKVHEGCGPFMTSQFREKAGLEDDYGGITGTLVPKHTERIAYALATGCDDTGKRVLSEHYCLRKSESVFCDIGSGTGRPCFYFASLPIKCSLGFDVDQLQVINSIACHRRLIDAGVRFACPVNVFKENALKLKSLDPVTHVYSFIGYPNFAFAIARLVADSPSVRVLAAVVLRMSEMIEAGFIESTDDVDVIKLTSLKMPGGNAYLGLVIPITPERRANLKRNLRPLENAPVLIPSRDTIILKHNECVLAGPDKPLSIPHETGVRPRRSKSTYSSPTTNSVGLEQEELVLAKATRKESVKLIQNPSNVTISPSKRRREPSQAIKKVEASENKLLRRQRITSG